MLWGDDSKIRDVTSNLDSIVQQPNCGYDYVFTAYSVTPTGPGTFNYTPLPISNSASF